MKVVRERENILSTCIYNMLISSRNKHDDAIEVIKAHYFNYLHIINLSFKLIAN